MIISPLVLTEVDHLAKARFGSRARTMIIDFVITQARQTRFQIPETGIEILDTARLVQKQYASLDLDLAGAVNVGLAAQYRTDAVLTLDRRDFRAVHPSPPIGGSGSCPTISTSNCRNGDRFAARHVLNMPGLAHQHLPEFRVLDQRVIDRHAVDPGGLQR